MSEEELRSPEAEALAKFFAKSVVEGFPGSNSAKKEAVEEVELAQRIGEIEIETQTAGASYIKVHIIDPEWALTKSGWLKVKEGLLSPIDVEFPEKSGWHWILCAVEGSTAVNEPNLVVTFEDRIVSWMRRYYGKKFVPPGTKTRAQFIRDLVNEIGTYGEEKVGFICPSLNEIQPVETEVEKEAKKNKTEQSKQEVEEEISKKGGLGVGSFKIKGVPATRQQALDVSTAIQVCNRLNVPTLAAEALLCAGIGESTFHREETNSSGHSGIWQSDTIPGNEVSKQAEYFLKGGESFQAGGAIHLAETKPPPTPGEIATKVEASGEPGSFYEAYLPEAREILAQIGGVKGAAEESASDVGQLQRGTTANPDEDSFECAVRLATQVDWNFFSNNHRFYYMDGPNFMRQKPALYIDIPANHIKFPNGEQRWGVINSPSTFTFDNALDVSTRVPTPDGYKAMGELRKGMLVYGSDGEPTKIIHHSRVFHGHDCYRLEFDDGSSFVANSSHLWETRPRDDVVGSRTTLELFETVEDDHRIETAPRPSGKFVTLIAVVPVPSVPTRCIEVEAADHLFVIGESKLLTLNTTYEYRISHKLTKRAQRKSKAVKPASPAEVKLLLDCGVNEFHAGQVFKFENSGPIDGVWIITNTRRKAFKDLYTEFILEPPIEPLPEPRSTNGTEEESPTNDAASGSALAAFNAASKLSTFELPYLWGGGHEAEGLTKVEKGGAGLDCSGSTCWVLHEAGMFPPTTAVVSGELEHWGEAGEGKEMTVFASAEHVYIEFNVSGHETAQMNTNGPQNGPRLYTLSKNPTYNGPKGQGSGGPYVARHWKGA